jgi:thiamine pyrophosphate-dependent acetolactate synthase large subunit-like protein
VIREADLVLSLDWIDLGGTIRLASAAAPVDAKVVSVTNDHVLHNGWSKDHFGLPAVDAHVTAHPDQFVREALLRLHGGIRDGWCAHFEATPAESGSPRAVRDLAAALREAIADREVCFVRLPLGWDGADLSVDHPLDYLGQDGGAGIGSGPGMTVGAALALRDSGRIPVAVLGDGDFMMGSSALWTAAHYRLPMVVVVANNRSFFNDEVHQERVARMRGRPVENRWVGQRISDPAPDLATIANGLGLIGHGPVLDGDDLRAVLTTAIDQAAAGSAVVVDVWVAANGYPGGPGVARKSQPVPAAG